MCSRIPFKLPVQKNTLWQTHSHDISWSFWKKGLPDLDCLLWWNWLSQTVCVLPKHTTVPFDENSSRSPKWQRHSYPFYINCMVILVSGRHLSVSKCPTVLLTCKNRQEPFLVFREELVAFWISFSQSSLVLITRLTPLTPPTSLDKSYLWCLWRVHINNLPFFVQKPSHYARTMCQFQWFVTRCLSEDLE